MSFLLSTKWLDHIKIHFLRLLPKTEMLMRSLDTNLQNQPEEGDLMLFFPFHEINETNICNTFPSAMTSCCNPSLFLFASCDSILYFSFCDCCTLIVRCSLVFSSSASLSRDFKVWFSSSCLTAISKNKLKCCKEAVEYCDSNIS